MSKHIVVFLLLFSSGASADAYIDADKPFLEIKDVNRQAETWAVCAASYDVMSTIMEAESPARAKQLSDLGHGAKLAAGMTLIVNDLEPDISTERFKTLWSNAQDAMTDWPQVQLSAILADAEELGTERSQEFGKRLSATVVICINNLEGQRMYIDTWQELINSGLLKAPGG